MEPGPPGPAKHRPRPLVLDIPLILAGNTDGTTQSFRLPPPP